MQHLNIPLKRHSKTTRPSGQVVWLLVGLLIAGGFLGSLVSALWFNSGTVLSLAPTDTILAVELRLNERTALFLLDWLAGVPLISDRSLELRDLAPYVHGDFAVFVTKGGERSVAIRASEDLLPSDLLNQNSIVTQKQGSFILLSSTLVPISGLKSFLSPILPSMGKTWLGRVIMPEDGLAGSLFVSSTSLTLEVKTPKRDTEEGLVVPKAAIVLNGLSWEQDEPVLPGLERLLSESSLILKNTRNLDIVIVPNESELEILLKIETSEAASDDLLKELEQIGAFAKPTITTQTLPDGSKLEEILVQPELVSVEEISTSLGVSYRVPVGGGSYVLAALHEGEVLFSNSQTLLENYAGALLDGEATICTASSNRVNPAFLVEQASIDHLKPQLGHLIEIFDDFSAISFEFKKYSTIMRLCRI